MKFIKLESTGNDFILVNNLDLKITLGPGVIKKLCHRQLGIGADGFILIEPPPVDSKYLFTMRYYNADGVEVEMCGNGARATTLFVSLHTDLLMTDSKALFKTYESECHATILESRNGNAIVSVEMPPIKDIDDVKPSDSWESGHELYLHTGVPHFCLECDDIKKADLIAIGRKYRYDYKFKNGTNVNLFKYIENGEVEVRTYERGVENETLSCGTGAVAVAYAVKRFYKWDGPINIRYFGGYLKVDLSKRLPLLTGPTRVVFEGILN